MSSCDSSKSKDRKSEVKEELKQIENDLETIKDIPEGTRELGSDVKEGVKNATRGS